jgi:hypothetical protein
MTTSGVVVVVARPFPDADAARAVQLGVFERQPGRLGLLAGDDHVDEVAAAQAVIDRRQQRVRVGREIHANAHTGCCREVTPV